MVYFLTGLALGVVAYLADSILPSLPVHVLGDTYFFTLIWPNDAHRPPISLTGPDASFWLNLAQALVFSALAVATFIYASRARNSVARRPAAQET